MKTEILNALSNIIRALNTVQVIPGKDNYLNQGGAIAMLEDVYQKIQNGMDEKHTKDDQNLTEVV